MKVFFSGTDREEFLKITGSSVVVSAVVMLVSAFDLHWCGKGRDKSGMTPITMQQSRDDKASIKVKGMSLLFT